MLVKSKKLKIRNLPQGNCCKGAIKSKPYGFLFFILAVSILFGLFHQYLLALACAMFFCYHMFFIPNEVLVEFYDAYAVFYHISNDRKECYILFWDEIEKWEIKKEKGYPDYLYVILKNQQELQLKCYHVHKMMRICNKCIAGQKAMMMRSHTS